MPIQEGDARERDLREILERESLALNRLYQADNSSRLDPESLGRVFYNSGRVYHTEDGQTVTTSDPQLEDHYLMRQQRRIEQDRRDHEERVRREREERVRQLEELNESRPNDPYITMCDFCHRGISNSEHIEIPPTIVGEDEICRQCINNYFFHCPLCNHDVLNSERHSDTLGNEGCTDCMINTDMPTCEHCGDFINVAHRVEGSNMCMECNSDINMDTEEFDEWDSDDDIDEDDDSVDWRSYSPSIHKKFCSKDMGDIVRSSRIFSAELETIYPDRETLISTANKVPKEFGVSTDGSISHNGVEWQTPKLQGMNGEKTMQKFCDVLTEKGFTTDVSCGLHVHLDGGKDFLPDSTEKAESFSATNLKILFLTYLVFEDVIHSFLPVTRRRNTYCKPMKDGYHISEVMNAYNLPTLEAVWYRATTPSYIMNCKSDRKHHSRYSGANLHTLLSGNHLEIRYHSGTTIGIKVLEWVNLHCLIMDAVAKGAINMNTITEGQEELDLKAKTEYLLDTIGISDRSKKYFLYRQEKFAKRSKIEEEKFNS